MASQCSSCSNHIVNADFVTCGGACKEMFHIKCVAVSKSMLNSVNTCPNIHWYCHECNGGNRNISASIDRIIASIGVLTTSMSGDLITFLNGFTKLTEKLMATVISCTHSNGQSINTSPQNCFNEENLRACNDGVLSKSKSMERSFIEPHIESFSGTSSTGSNVTSDREPLKSVVVSNIGNDVTLEYLTDYISQELNIDKGKLRLSLLIPSGRTLDELDFRQYKITLPEDKYDAILCLKSWPENVRIRDFVYKCKQKGVPKQHFLARTKCCLDSNSVNMDLSSSTGKC